MKKNVIIFGAGGTGRELFHRLQRDNSVHIIAFADSFKSGELYGLPILDPKRLSDLDFDYVYLATVFIYDVLAQLKELGIDENKIVASTVTMKGSPREVFLENLASEIYRKRLQGNVAEAGVFRGDFAKVINRIFPDRKLYLFDTFEGFDARDIAYEEGYDKVPDKGDYFSATSTGLIFEKMTHPEMVVIRKGYVPETFEGLKDTFCFVNLDMDLYKPTLEALRWFWPRMVKGGGILIHDYFDTFNFPNLKKGVIEFVEEVAAQSFPIGDGLSVFIAK